MTKLLFLAGCALLTADLAVAQHGEVSFRYWFVDSDQRIRVGDPALNTEIDLNDDLGFEDSRAPEGYFAYSTSGHSRFYLNYLQVDFDGDRDVQRTIVFDGQPYEVGTRVITETRTRYLRGGWAYRFGSSDGRFNAGPMISGHAVWLEASLAAPNLQPPVAQSEKLTVGYPTVGGVVDAYPSDRVSICGEFSGMSFGKYGSVLDGGISISVQPVRYLGLSGGYRYIRISPEVDDDFAKLRLSGPFVGIGLSF